MVSFCRRHRPIHSTPVGTTVRPVGDRRQMFHHELRVQTPVLQGFSQRCRQVMAGGMDAVRHPYSSSRGSSDEYRLRNATTLWFGRRYRQPGEQCPRPIYLPGNLFPVVSAPRRSLNRQRSSGGRAHKNTVVGPGRKQLEHALVQGFPVPERAKFRVPSRTFNTFTTRSGKIPTPSLGSTQFGQITHHTIRTAHLPVRPEVSRSDQRGPSRLLAYNTTAVGERTLSGSKE